MAEINHNEAPVCMYGLPPAAAQALAQAVTAYTGRAACIGDECGLPDRAPAAVILGSAADALPALPCPVIRCDALPLRLGALIDRLNRALRAGPQQEVVIGGWRLPPGESRLYGQGPAIVLTEKEQAILRKLHSQSGAVVEREALLQDVWGYAEGIETHTLETHIYRLRQKIEADPARPRYILTDGPGYRLAGQEGGRLDDWGDEREQPDG